MLYIVTGATGHLGNTITKKLIANGKKVRAFVLPNDNISMLTPLPHIEIIYGDITNYETLRPLCQNTKEKLVLIHTAGIISITDEKPKLMQKVNIEGTKNIIKLTKEFKIEHFIYISSVHAIPEPNEDISIKETLSFSSEGVVGAYAKTKALATYHVVERMDEGQKTTIIHPSGIIGPYDFGKAHMTQLFESYFNGKLNARVNGEYDFVDVRDVADAVFASITKKAYGPYLITGHKIKLKELFDLMQKTGGFKTKPLVFARWFVKIFIPLFESIAKRKNKPPLFTKYSLYTLETHCNFDNGKAKAILSYDPRPLADTIKDTAIWLVEQKRISRKKTIHFIINKYKLGL